MIGGLWDSGGAVKAYQPKTLFCPLATRRIQLSTNLPHAGQQHGAILISQSPSEGSCWATAHNSEQTVCLAIYADSDVLIFSVFVVNGTYGRRCKLV